MPHTEKQKLQKARAYFKFVITGLPKPVDTKYLTVTERLLWKEIRKLGNKLLEIHDDNSRILGLNVPEYRCDFCSKEAKYLNRGFYLCKNHIEENDINQAKKLKDGNNNDR